VPPRQVGQWEILSVLGRGGVGVVYRGRHRETRQLAAVKLLGPAPVVEPRAARRLAREYEVLRSLEHPNVVRVFEAGVSDGWSFLAMELVEGLDLRAFLSPALQPRGPAQPCPEPSFPPLAETGEGPVTALGPEAIRALALLADEPATAPETLLRRAAPSRPGPGEAPSPRVEPIPAARAAELNDPRRLERLRCALRQVLDALAYLHGRGLVHRDLKPSNIMVDDRRHVRIMDFGLVKPAEEEESLTGSGTAVGTYRYMSPEQAQGLPVDQRSDLYSLGVILYELLTGVPAFTTSDPGELWREILHQRPIPVLELNPDADPVLAAMVMCCLEKDPARRFTSAGEMIATLALLGRAPTRRAPVAPAVPAVEGAPRVGPLR
jgi:serine/threonine protein kinase